MNFITKRQHPKPVNYSNPWVVRRNKGKRLKFNDKDLERLLEFDDVFGLSQYDTGWNASYGTNAYIEDVDDTSSISSFSTNATMDNIPGTGRTIDMRFYQPVGRAIEKFALKIAIRLNICHPSPAQILRFFRLFPWNETWRYNYTALENFIPFEKFKRLNKRKYFVIPTASHKLHTFVTYKRLI